MGKDPAFMLYSQDFLVGVSDLTMEERGQYITMLCLQHQKGHLTKKNIQIAVGNVSEDVMSKFVKDDNGLYYNDILEKVILKREAYSQSRSENGKKGGRPRKEKEEVVDDWQEMLDFFGNKCIKCGSDCIGRPTKDHIVPQSWGGVDEISNWQPLCRECNSSKCADHATDYRYNFYDKIPENLRKKWFLEKHTKTICKAQKNHTEIENENINVIKDIIEYLNNKLGTRYKYTSKSIQKHINARIREGYKYEDFVFVIDIKYKDWYGTEMAKYLRPETLFNSEKFQSYINQKGATNEVAIPKYSTTSADDCLERALERTYEKSSY